MKLETSTGGMAALYAAIREKKLKRGNVILDGRVKPGHDNRKLIKTVPALGPTYAQVRPQKP
jgi:hypothetical protein